VNIAKSKLLTTIKYAIMNYVVIFKVGEYQKAGVMAKKEDRKFTLDADF